MTASTVAQYLAALPADRRAALSAVPKTINENQTTDDIQADNQFSGSSARILFSVSRPSR